MSDKTSMNSQETVKDGSKLEKEEEAKVHQNNLKDSSQLEEEIKTYQNDLKENPGKADDYAKFGEQFLAIGQTQKAKQYCLKAIEIDQNHFGAHFNLGNVYHNQFYSALAIIGQQQSVKKGFQKSTHINSTKQSSFINFGDLLFDLSQFQQAKDCYTKALEINPDSSSTNYKLGNALKITNKLEEAITCYQKAIRINPMNYQAHCDLGNILIFTETQRAIDSYLKSIEANPYHTYPFLCFLFSLKRHSQSIGLELKNKIKQRMHQLIKPQMNSFLPLFNAGFFFYSQKQEERSNQYFNKLYQLLKSSGPKLEQTVQACFANYKLFALSQQISKKLIIQQRICFVILEKYDKFDAVMEKEFSSNQTRQEIQKEIEKSPQIKDADIAKRFNQYLKKYLDKKCNQQSQSMSDMSKQRSKMYQQNKGDKGTSYDTSKSVEMNEGSFSNDEPSNKYQPKPFQSQVKSQNRSQNKQQFSKLKLQNHVQIIRYLSQRKNRLNWVAKHSFQQQKQQNFTTNPYDKFKIQKGQSDFKSEEKNNSFYIQLLYQQGAKEIFNWIYCFVSGIIQLQDSDIFHCDFYLRNTIKVKNQKVNIKQIYVYKISDFNHAFGIPHPKDKNQITRFHYTKQIVKSWLELQNIQQKQSSNYVFQFLFKQIQTVDPKLLVQIKNVKSSKITEEEKMNLVLKHLRNYMHIYHKYQLQIIIDQICQQYKQIEQLKQIKINLIDKIQTQNQQQNRQHYLNVLTKLEGLIQ